MISCECIKTDVLIVGAGLAGITAALTAAQTGADVCLISRGAICGGSSFYDGTWGLGLVGPEDAADASDLEATILSVGQEMAHPELVHRLVSGIADGIAYLEALQVPLQYAGRPGEKAYIPCFDHKNRSWHGFEKAGAIPVLQRQLARYRVRLFPQTTVCQLIKKAGRVYGASALSDHPIRFTAGAVVLATGGLGGLFQYHLNTADVCGQGHYLALLAGASLVNLEFMQMMPGFLTPAHGTIYNEKMFAVSRFMVNGISVFQDWPAEQLRQAMAVRATHGPYTTRLISGNIDQALYQACLEHPEGVMLTYDAGASEHWPEFVQTYFQWLDREKHLTEKDPVHIGIFAHASNGGIRIDGNAFTGVPGLYACGEVTGGMHGADRLGGLSTANALVFGRIAGASAAACAKSTDGDLYRTGDQDETDVKEPYLWPHARACLRELRKRNARTAMVLRSREGSEQTLAWLASQRSRYEAERVPAAAMDLSDGQQIKTVLDMEAALVLSQALHQAILQRKESRGPHCRTDHAGTDSALAHPLYSHLVQGQINTIQINTYKGAKHDERFRKI